MFESLVSIFSLKDDQKLSDDKENLKLLIGLMLEAANSDGNITQVEINKISNSLIEIFKENPDDVETILKNMINNIDDQKSLHFYTSKINKNFEYEKKLLLIKTLWEIILSDGEVHDFESNLIRRLAGLMYLSDVDCGNAKKIAEDNLKLKGKK